MNIKANKYIWFFFGVLLAAMVGAYLANALSIPESRPFGYNSGNSDELTYVTVRDAEGNVILETGIPVAENDEYINESNVHYLIIKVEGKNAVAVIKEDDREPDSFQSSFSSAPSLFPSAISAQADDKDRHVLIYHTHNDESYELTSNTSSKRPKGDIIKVGEALKQALNRSGIKVTHIKNDHGPHDIHAYNRSRRSVASEIKKKTPDAIFDIHRDAAPSKNYYGTVNGVEISKIMVVVGRSNPNMKTNLQYARRIKKIADEVHPGLIRGIYIGRGDYNQDLYPTALLLEVGTNTNSLTMAERGARCLADVLIKLLGKE
ncbi:MAG: stage II sporulation protein P [Syntrophomonadaceae bacterium]